MKNQGKLSKYIQYAHHPCEILIYIISKLGIWYLLGTKIIHLNTLSIRLNNEEEEEMCKDFLILLVIKNLRTFLKEVRKKHKKESYQIPAICVVKMSFFLKYFN